LILIRSRTSIRCGEVYNPVRKPDWRRIRSVKEDVEPLPFVPWESDGTQLTSSF
jgi:hypothetical protein